MSFDSGCNLCPRRCRVNRNAGERGFCGQTSDMRISRAALHFWEEPCISGTRGSGAVFFTGCNLGCVYCQNAAISRSGFAGVCAGSVKRRMDESDGTAERCALRINGKDRAVEKGVFRTPDELAETFLDLQAQGAHNINLVTPTHFLPGIRDALERAKDAGLSIPVVYNCGGYEDTDALRSLEGLVDVWLPDCKYHSDELAVRLSNAPGYYGICLSAIREMLRQSGEPVFADQTGEGRYTAEEYNALCGEEADDYRGPVMVKGVIVRHLVLPGQYADSERVIRGLYEAFGDSVYISLMSQYTPMPAVSDIPALNRRIDLKAYDRLVDLCIRLGITNCFFQGGDVAEESFIPEFC